MPQLDFNIAFNSIWYLIIFFSFFYCFVYFIFFKKLYKTFLASLYYNSFFLKRSYNAIRNADSSLKVSLNKKSHLKWIVNKSLHLISLFLCYLLNKPNKLTSGQVSRKLPRLNIFKSCFTSLFLNVIIYQVREKFLTNTLLLLIKPLYLIENGVEGEKNFDA